VGALCTFGETSIGSVDWFMVTALDSLRLGVSVFCRVHGLAAGRSYTLQYQLVWETADGPSVSAWSQACMATLVSV
jgi:hypothetical protein